MCNLHREVQVSDLTQALAEEKVCSLLQIHSGFYSVAHGKLSNREACSLTARASILIARILEILLWWPEIGLGVVI